MRHAEDEKGLKHFSSRVTPAERVRSAESCRHSKRCGSFVIMHSPLSARLAEAKSLEKTKPPSNFVVRNNSTRHASVGSYFIFSYLLLLDFLRKCKVGHTVLSSFGI